MKGDPLLCAICAEWTDRPFYSDAKNVFDHDAYIGNLLKRAIENGRSP